MAGTPPLSPKAAAAAETAEAECKKCQAARDEALARAAQAEKEATDVAKEINALAVCQGKALQHAAAARKVAAAGDDGPVSDNQSDASANDLHNAMLHHEAAAVINLHAQAVGVQNIHSLVHSVLATGNYNRARRKLLL